MANSRCTCSVLAWDNMAPSKSRLKWYFLTESTSFTSVREIMTMGGLLDVPEDRLQDLRSLITIILELPDDYPEDAKLTSAPPAPKTWPEQGDLAEGFTYFFDIALSRKPDVKFYLPTQRFGADDITIAHRLIDWMKTRGRGDYGDRYLGVVHALAEHRDLGTGKGLHSYINLVISSPRAAFRISSPIWSPRPSTQRGFRRRSNFRSSG